MKRMLLSSLLLGMTGLPLIRATACSTILAGRQATADGSVLMSHSCDGDVMGLVYVMPAQSYPPGTRLPMYWNVPRPSTYEKYQANLRKGYDQVGTLPVSDTCRSLILAGNLESMTTGDHFLASRNVFSLAEGLSFWKPGTRFVWHDVYGGLGDRSNSLREWRALGLVAPSLGLKVTGDPQLDCYPFSVTPDRALTVPKLMGVMRDSYEGTEFDLTAQGAFKAADGRSPLACPWGPPELLDLLGLKPERAICTPTSGYVFVAQLRSDVPKAIGNLLWFAYGPANTSCFVPLYAGVTHLPDTWDHPANFTRMDRQQAQWNFRLVHNLAQRLPYQKVIKDVQAMVKPAEQRYLDLQTDLEQTAVGVFRKQGPKAAEAFLTAYASDSARNVGFAYSELVDYLMLRFLVGDPEYASPTLPRIAAPKVPDAEFLEERSKMR